MTTRPPEETAAQRQVPIWFWPAFGAAMAASLAPLAVAPILPFNDLHGAAGLLGAWLHRANPAARIEEYFKFNVHAAPNVLYWAVGWALTRVASVTTATNIYIGLFCVAALPLTLLFALRSFGKDPVLSLVAFPVVYHRCLWFGFMGSVPAVSLLILAIALANRSFQRSRPSWNDVALAGTLFLLAAAHAFLFVVSAAIVALWAAFAHGKGSPLWRRGVVFLPSLAYLGPWLATTFLWGGTHAGQRRFGVLPMVAHLWNQRQPFGTYVANIRNWLIEGYRSPLDDVVAGIFAATLASLLLFGIRGQGSASTILATPFRDERYPATSRQASRTKWLGWLWTRRLGVTAGLLAGGYFLLPMSISVPFGWWAVNVRLLVPTCLVLLLAIRSRARGLPRAIVLPAAIAAIAYGGYLTYDFRTWWMRVELDGLPEAIAAIPAGKRVHALYPRFEDERHYSHFPMGYIVDYYVVDRGGTASPIMSGHPNEMWIRWVRQGPGPAWGMAHLFRWADHSPGWDYFLVKQPAPRNGSMIKPFADAPPGSVQCVFERGLWSVWRRER